MAAEAAGGRRRKSRNWESRKQKSEAARRALLPCLFLLSAFLISALAFIKGVVIDTDFTNWHGWEMAKDIN